MSDKLLWWGYEHSNGSYQAKRYFQQLDFQEAIQSPFCKIVVGPFEATDRDDAINTIVELVGEIKCGVDD
jgi:hypothetical protein